MVGASVATRPMIGETTERNSEYGKEDDERHAAEQRELQVSERHLFLDEWQQNVNDGAIEIVEDVDEREQPERIPRIKGNFFIHRLRRFLSL